MADPKSVTGGTNPFYENDDEVDDFTFLSHPQQGRSGYMLGDDKQENKDWELRRQQILEERRRIEERTLQGTNRSLGMLYEAEQVGIATAEELVHQGEQLKNVEQKVDEINRTMRISQKHINSMKSVFGSIKNFLSRNSSTESAKPPVVEVPESQYTSTLQNRLEKAKESAAVASATSHPALKARGIAYEEEEDPWAELGSDTGPGKSQSNYKSRSEEIDTQLDKNLDDMSLGLVRLKNLAVGLHDEIIVQNDTLDRITDKVDKADVSLAHQNRQIRHILKQ